jgi:site-specific DNA-methyltransferase (adenine-specific)
MPNPLRHHSIPIASLLESTDRPRQRQEFDSAALLELADSIKKHGLFHAIVVRPDGKTLVAGERRLRAIEEHLVPLGVAVRYGGETLPLGHIPVVPVATEDPLALEEIELDENFRRVNLSWQEHTAAVARLHQLRGAQANALMSAAIASGRVPEEEGLKPHTVAATAVEVRGSSEGDAQNTTRQEIILAQHLHRPEIAAAKSVKEAFKTLKRLEEGERNRVLAAAVGATYTADVHQAFHASCLEWMTGPEWQGKFDVILTDPPYGMGAHEFGDSAGRLAGIDHQYDDSYESWVPLMQRWTELSYAVTKPQAHAYVFCDIDRFHELRGLMQKAGWYVFRTPLINVKGSGRVPLPDKGPRRQYEICLYAIKGDKTVTAIYPDVITSSADEQMQHGAQKPVELYVNLLRRSCRPGDWVLDCFAGTGTILPAAHEMKLVGVAVEQSASSYGLCVKRLEALKAQPELPNLSQEAA